MACIDQPLSLRSLKQKAAVYLRYQKKEKDGKRDNEEKSKHGHLPAVPEPPHQLYRGPYKLSYIQRHTVILPGADQFTNPGDKEKTRLRRVFSLFMFAATPAAPLSFQKVALRHTVSRILPFMGWQFPVSVPDYHTSKSCQLFFVNKLPNDFV